MSKNPILYCIPGSPPCSSVRLAAAALGVNLDTRLVNLLAGEHLKPEFLKLNPSHTVPILDDNGVVVTDSHVICSYLADKYAVNDSLYPKDKLERMKVDALLYFDATHLFPRARLIVEPIIFFGADEISQQSVNYMQNAYDNLEKNLIGSKYLCGDNYTIADLCCIATVTSAMLFAPIDANKFPNIRAWVERLTELPYFATISEEGPQALRKLIDNKLEENKKSKK